MVTQIKGLTPGSTAHPLSGSKFGETGTLSQSKNGWDHFVGYWENTNGVIERGLFVNGYPIRRQVQAHLG